MLRIERNRDLDGRLRRLARSISLVVTALWLLMAGVSMLAERGPWTWEHWGITTMIGLAVVVTALAWGRPVIGGALMLTFAVVFSLFAYISAGRNEAGAALITGGPYAVAGVLHLAAQRRTGAGIIRPA